MASSTEPLKREAEEAEEAPETAVAAVDEDTGAQVAPIVKLQEVAVSTGEEEENVLIDLRAKLYRFDKEGNQWKERGVGTVKLLKHKETEKVRLVMRQSKTLKICANHFVTPAFSVQEHAGNDKSCVWHATDYADGELKEELFCIRFPSIENCKSFKETIEEVTESQKKTTKEEVEEADSAANLLGNLTVKESTDQEVKPDETAGTTEEKKDATVTANKQSDE